MVVKIKRLITTSNYLHKECVYEVYTDVTYYKHNIDTQIIDLKLNSVNPITVKDVVGIDILKC